MRLFLSLAFIIGGLGLFLHDALAHAFVTSDTNKYVHQQLQSLPQRPQYSSDELAEVVWQTWTNRLKLPSQETYAASELKTAVAKPFVNSSQAVYDQYQLQRAIKSTAGFQMPERGTGRFLASLGILVGVFLMGGIIYPDALKDRSCIIWEGQSDGDISQRKRQRADF